MLNPVFLLSVASSTTIDISFVDGYLNVESRGDYRSSKALTKITILGLEDEPRAAVQDVTVSWNAHTKTATMTGLQIDLHQSSLKLV